MEIELRRGYFCALNDGDEIGEAVFESYPQRIIITHVGVSPEYRGQGIARQLVMACTDYARENELKVTPQCPYAKAVFDRNPHLSELLY